MVGLVAISVFLLTAAGVWLLLQRRTLRVAIGLALLSHAVNLILLSSGLWGRRPPLVLPGVAVTDVSDPVPQAFVLTAVVISMALTLYLLAGLAARAQRGESTLLSAPPENDGDVLAEVVRAELEGRVEGAES